MRDLTKTIDIASVAQRAKADYRERRRKRSVDVGRHVQHTTFSRHGVELQVAACYAAGFTIQETLAHLQECYSVKTSKTAVGRLFRDFFEHGVLRSPVKLELNS